MCGPDPIDVRLLEDFQRDLPLVARPFAAMAGQIGISEADAIARLGALRAGARIARVGATVRPNTVGASTLAALAVPAARIEEVAALVGAEPGVNHSYLRDGDWNLWFVVTAPDAGALAGSLARIGARSGLQVLDLPLVRAFNIDLGFSLTGDGAAMTPATTAVDRGALQPGDRAILQALSEGLALVPRPFAALARQVQRSEAGVIARIEALSRAGIISRLGVIVRHRALGWAANAMVVWDIPAERIAAAGRRLARFPGVTLCYERPRIEGLWRFPLFTMIHAKSEDQALAVLDRVRGLPELAGCDHRVMFSRHCFKQSGALLERTAAQ